MVSTHSRPKAAGDPSDKDKDKRKVSTHSRPKAAGVPDAAYYRRCIVSTHSRPKAAGSAALLAWLAAVFQHTAARRRLGLAYKHP